MLTEICGYLKNWFNRRPDGTDYPKYHGTFKVEAGNLTWESGAELPLQTGQYFRILGSISNMGVFQWPAKLKDEVFEGDIWSMAVPVDVIALAKEIEDWNEIYGKATSAAMSPFTAESFAVYSYTKASGRNADSSSAGVSWMDVFGSRLSRYKKL